MSKLTLNKPVATPTKHVFDTSHRHVFSAKVGQLIPLPLVDTIPNGDYEIDIKDLLRTKQLNQAAFLRCSQCIDVFFVPYSQIFTRFNQFISQRHDPVTAGSTLPIYVPHFNLFELLEASIRAASKDYNIPNKDFFDIFEFNKGKNAGRLMDLLNYGSIPIDVPFSKLNSVTNKYEISSEWQFYFLHILGIQDEGFNDIVTDTYTSNEQAISNVFDYLHDIPAWQYQVAPWYIGAYNKIWNDFYRNPYRDEPLDPIYFNFDDISCANIATSSFELSGDREPFNLFKLHYRRWKNDIYTSSYPNPQFGDATFVPVTGSTEFIWSGLRGAVIAEGSPTEYYDAYSNQTKTDSVMASRARDILSFETDSIYSSEEDPQGKVRLGVDRFAGTNDFGISVASLRLAFSMQHYAENVIRAGNRTSDNFKAHYGTAPVYDNDMHVKFLGSVQQRLDLNIVSTSGGAAETETGVSKPVGSLTSNGISVIDGQDKIRYRAHDFGVIMAIFSILPEAEYNNTMVAKVHSQLTPFDFPTTELDDIGFQPIYSDQLFAPYLPFGVYNGQRTVGFAPPYVHYKTAVDKVHGDFQRWYADVLDGTITRLVDGSKASFVAPRSQMQYDRMRTRRSLYINPHVYDTIFGVSADVNQSSDQFDVNCKFEISNRLPLSVLGLPNY